MEGTKREAKRRGTDHWSYTFAHYHLHRTWLFSGLEHSDFLSLSRHLFGYSSSCPQQLPWRCLVYLYAPVGRDLGLVSREGCARARPTKRGVV